MLDHGKKIRKATIVNIVIFKFQTLKNHTVALDASLSKNLLVVLTKDKHFFLTEKVSLGGHKTFTKAVRLVLFVPKKKEKVRRGK